VDEELDERVERARGLEPVPFLTARLWDGHVRCHLQLKQREWWCGGQ
jgi:hypothetical protein